MKMSNTIVVCAFICYLSTYAHADDRYWICGDDSWDNPICWNTSSDGGGTTGLPLANDNVYLTQSDSTGRSVNYTNDLSPTFEYLTIDSTGTGSMTLTQDQGEINFHNGYIGYDGMAIVNINGGTFGGFTGSSGPYLYIGQNPGSYGTLNLSGTGNVTMFAGHFHHGVINQNGGTLSSDNGLWFGHYSSIGQFATYNLSAGFVYASLEVTSNGIVNQSGGEVNTLADPFYVEGLYNMSGGLLQDDITSENTSTISGVFNQTGGSHIMTGHADYIPDGGGHFGMGITGEYNMSGGTLDVARIRTTDVNGPGTGNGVFNFTGGSLFIDYFFGDLVNDGGILAPVSHGPINNQDFAVGLTEIEGDYSQSLDGVLSLEIGGLVSELEYDLLNVSGTATLGGTLEVSLFDFGSGLFPPSLGDSFDILLADTIIGEFDILTLATLGTGLVWDVSYILDDFSTDIVRLSVVQAVPILPSVWLFGSGLLGLVGVARKKRS